MKDIKKLAKEIISKNDKHEFVRRIKEVLDIFVLSESDLGQNSISIEEAEKIVLALLADAKKKYGKI